MKDKPNYRICFEDSFWIEYEYILKRIDTTGYLLCDEDWYGFRNGKLEVV